MRLPAVIPLLVAIEIPSALELPDEVRLEGTLSKNILSLIPALSLRREFIVNASSIQALRPCPSISSALAML